MGYRHVCVWPVAALLSAGVSPQKVSIEMAKQQTTKVAVETIGHVSINPAMHLRIKQFTKDDQTWTRADLSIAGEKLGDKRYAWANQLLTKEAALELAAYLEKAAEHLSPAGQRQQQNAGVFA